MKKRVLFLCTSNRCRSQMAEALVNHDMADSFVAFSAGTHPTHPHPLALKVLAEIGIDHNNSRSKHLDEFINDKFDFVITLCDNANRSCPVFPGGDRRVHLGFEDPDKAEGDIEAKLVFFRKVRDEIRDKVEKFLANPPDENPTEIKLELDL